MHTVKISTHATKHGKTYYTTLSATLLDLKLPNSGWIFDQLQILQSTSQEKSLLRSDLDLYIKSIKILSSNEDALALLIMPAEQVGRAEVTKLFLFLEQLLSEFSTTPRVRQVCSHIFRKIVLKCAQKQRLKEDVTRINIGFRTKLGGSFPPRQLISDLKNLELDSDLAAPVGALTHTDVRELLRKAEFRLERDIEQIREACLKQLEICNRLRTNLIELGEAKYEAAKVSAVESTLNQPKRMNNKAAEVIQDLSAAEHLGIIQQLIRSHDLSRADRSINPTFWFNERLFSAYLLGDQKNLIGQGYRLNYLTYRIITDEILACFVLLLTYTGWNSSTLIAMSVDDVRLEDNCVVLKGYKSKTDSYVADVYLDTKQRGCLEAIKLLLWNRVQLINLGFLPKSSKWLWCTWSLTYGPIKNQFIGFQDALRRLQAQYTLPKFSLDQIRPQTLAHASISMQNPEYVRQLASHKSLVTTGHYLDQLLLRSLNSAINLEFQRRLENTVQFRLAETDPFFGDTINLKHVDLSLLVPTGDGASCINPTSPPDENYMLGGICDGKRCHVGDGCSNRRLFLDENNLDALVRKRRYYLTNWRRLEQTNEKAFEKFHLPAILFTLGLYDYVKNSSYRHFLEAAEKGLERANQKAL